MTTASSLLRRHFQTLIIDNAQWRTLIADDVVWELAYAPPSATRRGYRGGRKWNGTPPGS